MGRSRFGRVDLAFALLLLLVVTVLVPVWIVTRPPSDGTPLKTLETFVLASKDKPWSFKWKGPRMPVATDPVLIYLQSFSPSHEGWDLALNMAQRNSILSVAPSVADDKVVLVVSTKRGRALFVERLLKSLTNIEGLPESEVIVAVDGYDEVISSLAKKVYDFPLRVVTFPASPVAFESSYPGKDPRDCERDTDEAEQMRRGCTGKADRFGHFREPDFVSPKLHWVWMWNWIFSVFLPKDFVGNVVALSDECVIRSTSFYVNAKKLWQLQPQVCPDCRGVCMFNPIRAEEGEKKLTILESANKAYGFSRRGWADLVAKMNLFCEYEDLNWDVTSDWMPTETFGFLAVQVSQVSLCPSFSCLVQPRNDVIDETWILSKSSKQPKSHQKAPRGASGGWSDPRDIQLCKLLAGSE